MAWWSSTSWYFFDAWYFSKGQWARKYSRGPVELTKAQAESEYLDTFEAHMGGTTRMFRWNGTYWERVYG